jgi:CDP-glucose 4,6-dehydratase
MEMPLGQRLRELPGPLLLTGHTGFKGTWMTFLLEHLNVPVVGYSLPAEKGSLFDRAERRGAISEDFSDIRDYEALERFIDLHKPSTIIHMAAQPLVLKSYERPRETFEVNVMGTVNLLDIAFKKDFIKAIIVVTTDKVYRNDNSGRSFIETDPLEGKDPYSASKVGTESVVTAWQQIAKVSGGPRLISVRAGNVIGGGDFAENRIIPDLVRGAMSEKPVEIRNPNSTRPWQHVLDPLNGYLLAMEALIRRDIPATLNFGPKESGLPVSKIANAGHKKLETLLTFTTEKNNSAVAPEATALDLNSELAQNTLKWEPLWNQEKAIERTFEWWNNFFSATNRAFELCLEDIIDFRENQI